MRDTAISHAEPHYRAGHLPGRGAQDRILGSRSARLTWRPRHDRRERLGRRHRSGRRGRCDGCNWRGRSSRCPGTTRTDRSCWHSGRDRPSRRSRCYRGGWRNRSLGPDRRDRSHWSDWSYRRHWGYWFERCRRDSDVWVGFTCSADHHRGRSAWQPQRDPSRRYRRHERGHCEWVEYRRD